MGSRKNRKPAVSAPGPNKSPHSVDDTATAPAERMGADEIFSVPWVLGFCIFCEFLFFMAQELAQAFLDCMASALPSGLAALIAKYLSAAFSALALLLIFSAGIWIYSVWKKELRPIPVKIVSIALFLFGHIAAAAVSDSLTALLLLPLGRLFDLGGNGAAVAGIILSFLLRIVSETALVSWALRRVETRL